MAKAMQISLYKMRLKKYNIINSNIVNAAKEAKMKFAHLSDLHIGKRFKELSLIDDQEYILSQIVDILSQEKPDAVFICGDIYDKASPSAEAVALFDQFLVNLAKLNLQIFVISGNHDSPERIAFGQKLLQNSNVYMSPVYNADIKPVIINADWGDICIFMLPFIKPPQVRALWPEAIVNSYHQALAVAIDNLDIDKNACNILLTHQFITGSERSDSEQISVGGADNIGAEIFNDFDYIALGHIHKPQVVGRETLRYCGSPLKYSFSEANHQKSLTIGQIKAKKQIELKTVKLIPKRDMIELKGTYLDLMAKDFYAKLNLDDYYHLILTDEENIPDALNKLRIIYKNILKLSYDNQRSRAHNQIDLPQIEQAQSPLSLIDSFYQIQNNQPLSAEQKDYLLAIIAKMEEASICDH